MVLLMPLVICGPVSPSKCHGSADDLYVCMYKCMCFCLQFADNILTGIINTCFHHVWENFMSVLLPLSFLSHSFVSPSLVGLSLPFFTLHYLQFPSHSFPSFPVPSLYCFEGPLYSILPFASQFFLSLSFPFIPFPSIHTLFIPYLWTPIASLPFPSLLVSFTSVPPPSSRAAPDNRVIFRTFCPL